MSDRELLELAAKACGIPVTPDCHIPSGGMWMLHVDIDRVWNPLGNDGDALRLAVKLGMTIRCDLDQISCMDRTVVSSPWGYRESVVENWSDDGGLSRRPERATRRAIVRAAAAIGKAMQ